jgi:hypothetical protein
MKSRRSTTKNGGHLEVYSRTPDMYYRQYGDIGYVYRLGRLHAALANSRMQDLCVCVCVCVCVCLWWGGDGRGGESGLGSQQRFAKRKATFVCLHGNGNALAEGENRALPIRLP